MKTHNQAKTSWPQVRRLRAAYERSQSRGVKFDFDGWALRLGISRRSTYRIAIGETWQQPKLKTKKGTRCQ